MWSCCRFLTVQIGQTHFIPTLKCNWGANFAMAATAVSQVLPVAKIWAGTNNELHCFLKINLTSDTLKKSSVAVLLLV